MKKNGKSNGVGGGIVNGGARKTTSGAANGGTSHASHPSQARQRCAVYTRKSSEEGLDQAFNSLDAQREACVAYIASQASLGWKLVPEHYDDGGISGGTLERPAIQRLLQHISDGKVDVVVVYKIDRLTRSLTDFARLVEVFDGHSVSFVSVTQQFNTTTSMGRLTLNVLLSFAQFEREVTAERIRDKIAASKQKGMWMGGNIPFGYKLGDRKLLIDEANAAKVRHIFQRYLELGSVNALMREVNAMETGGRSIGAGSNEDRQSEVEPGEDKPGEEKPGDGKPARSFKIMSHGHLRHILGNPLYIGKVRHHDRTYEGEHEGIVDPEVFEEVQELLADNVPNRRGRPCIEDSHFLTGLVFDETGDRLSPTHASNHGKRYRYYISRRLRYGPDSKKEGWRIAADELERIVLWQVQAVLTNRPLIASWLERVGSVDLIERGLAAAAALAIALKQEASTERRKQMARIFFKSITLSPTGIRFVIRKQALIRHLLPIETGTSAISDSAGSIGITDDTDDATITIEHHIALKRRGVEARIVVGATSGHHPDPALIELITRAHHYLNRLTDGSVSTIGELATALSIHRAEISRILPLAFLSPTITEAILTGRQPVDLAARSLARLVDVPPAWADQAKALGI